MWPHNQDGYDFYYEYRGLPLSEDIGLHTMLSNMSSCPGGYNYPCSNGMHPPEPNQGWHVYEIVSLHHSLNGFFRIYVDNQLVYEKYECDEFSPDINSFWLGGYFRAASSPESGDENGFRYFDDVYADRGFQRVVLANNPHYEDATIIEPQIPSAWSENSISFTANLGQIPDSGEAYL